MIAAGDRGAFAARWVGAGGLGLLAALLVSLVFVSPAAAKGAGGRPDRSFGDGGRVAVEFGPTFLGSAFEAVEATGADGVRVWQRGPNGEGFRQYLPGGTLGVEAGGPEREPLRTVQADGKTVEVEFGGYRERDTILRRLANGQLDPSFGSGGEEVLPYFSESSTKDRPWAEQSYPQSVLVLPSGKLVVAGRSVFNQVVDARSMHTDYEVAVLRLEADGRTDTGFGGDGLVTTSDLGTAASGALELGDITPWQGDGLVLGLRTAWQDGGSLVAVSPTGSLEKSFSGGTRDVPGYLAGVHAAGDGKVLVAGSDRGDFFVSRFGPDGQPDPGFATAGTAQIDLGGDDKVNTALWEASGSVLLGGASTGTDRACELLGLCLETPALARVDAGGQLDAGFGSGGKLRLTSLGAGRGTAGPGVIALAARPAGGAFAAGASGTTAFVAALDQSGRGVAGFGTDGILEDLYPRPSSSAIAAVAVDRQRRIVVVGSTNTGREEEAQAGGFALRLRPDGDPDPSFGKGDGSVSLPPEPEEVAIDRHGRALVLDDHSVLRLTGSGQIDTSFADGGVLQPKPPKKFIEANLKAIAALPSGKLLVAGAVGSLYERMVVYRFRADGSPDRSFGHGGWQVLPIGNENQALGALELLGEGDGGALVGGYVEHLLEGPGVDWHRTMVVARLLPNGDLDPRFGRRGVVRPPLRGNVEVSSLARGRGAIFVAGTEQRAGRATATILRYHRNGRLDHGFGRGGAVRTAAAANSQTKRAGNLTLLSSPRRLVLVRAGVPHPVSAYRLDGTPIRGYGSAKSVLPLGVRGGRAAPPPVAALQGIKPILAWSARNGHPGGGTTGWIQRLKAG